MHEHLLDRLLSPDHILTQYAAELHAEYQTLAPSLPHTVANILDVGCGLGGIDIFLFRHYRNQNPRIFLMDKTLIDAEIHYGHREVGSFYNDLTIARTFLAQNGVPPANISLVDAERGAIAKQPVAFDLILSLLSWGFHYDLSMYLDEVLAKLAHGAAIIVDVRKQSASSAELEARFGGRYSVIGDFPKYQRVKVAPT